MRVLFPLLWLVAVAIGQPVQKSEFAVHPLILAPVLTFTGTTGGSGTDTITGVGRDAAGNIYLAGWTDSTVFSSTVANFSRSHSVDAFVMKLNGATKSLVYLTYLAGAGDDRALGIAVDGDGYVYVCGSTSSTDFPTVNALQTVLSGSRNAFLAKLDQAGRKILFSTYFGGAGNTSANAIALDMLGNVLIAGQTDSTTLPTSSPFQPANAGGLDAFVAKFNSSGAIQYATYLGGSGDDIALGLATDSIGYAYVTGSTTSANFPVVNALQSKRKGYQDAFVTKLNRFGAVYSTYLGGSGGGIGQPESGNAITVDSQGNAYVAGTTSSVDFPVTGAYQSTSNGWNSDAFIAKLNASGSQLIFSTYLGGGDMDVATSIRLDSAGDVYVAGYTASMDFPTVQAVQRLPGGLYDAFLAELGPAGNTLLFASVFGGGQNDLAYSLAGTNEVIVGGSTSSSDLFNNVLGIDAFEFGIEVKPVPPFGVVDTPLDNTTGLSGAIAVTGWSLCDDQVPVVGIYREPVVGEGRPPSGLIFLGNATGVNGSRPDVAAKFPSYEFNARSGWGFAVLTNMLPNSAGGANPAGNGTFRFHAIATNLQNQAVDVGAKTVSVDNLDSTAPFGTIDTPAQGQTISGTGYVNFGWALTPKPATIPVDGSTIRVFIDGIFVGHPTYNNYRSDIATFFPGLNNSNGAIGFYIINTTLLVNGLHTISWSVSDNAGHAMGIGSRYFLVQN